MTENPASGFGRGVHVAFSWLTVAPLPQPRGDVDRVLGARVIAAVPMVGAVLGALLAALAWGLSSTSLPGLLIGVLCVAAGALATRGMHLDGLADTADGLGCYSDHERVRQVMRSGSVGPFGAATLTLTMLVQAVAIGGLAEQQAWWAIGFAVFLGRFAVVVACRRALPPAGPDGFGALVSGTQSWSIAVWTAAAAGVAVAISWLTASHTAWHAVAPLVAVAVFAWGFTAHCARRMGGSSGDVLGATIELSAALALILLLLG